MIIPNDPFVGTHYIGKEEMRAVKEVLKSKSLFRHHGPNLLYKTNQLEQELAKFLGVKHVLAVSNGAAAVKLACIGNGIGYGDEVLMSPFTFIASAASVLSVGAIPKFIDIDETMNIDPKKIDSKITSKTKAIMAIHMQGQPCDMESIMKIAKKHKLIVIEDTAQALGSKIGNKYAGTFGTGAFSLQAGKTITCGEGGFLTTNDSKVYKKAKMYHDNGGYRIGDNYPTWENGETFYGENFKLTEIQSAVALEQLKKIDKIIEKQRKNYDYLADNLDKSYILRPLIKGHKRINVSLCALFDTLDRCDKFIAYMNKKGISFNKYCSNLINNFDVFKHQNSWHKSGFPFNTAKYKKEDCKASDDLFRKAAWFNLSASLTKKHLNYIVKKMDEYALGECDANKAG
jgi:dTDP-4-amino-4,6-dideoxygalactose transaminase